MDTQLTPEEIAAFDKASGLKTDTSIQPDIAQASNKRYEELIAKSNAYTISEGEKAQKFLNKSTAGQLFSKETAKELPGQAFKTAKSLFVNTPVKVAKSLADIPYQLATGKDLPGTYQQEARETAGDIIDGKKPLISALKPFVEVPLDVMTTAAGAKGIYNIGKSAVKNAPAVYEKGKDLVTAGKNAIQNRSTIKNTAKTIEAISETPKGVKGAKAYQEIATKGRKVQTKGFFSEQKLGASEREALRGERLADLKLSPDNHIKNLKKIGTDLKTTETKLETALNKDPDFVYNLDKQTIMTKLEKAKSEIPEGFKSDKSMKTTFDSVMKYAQKIINKTDDTLTGGRKARSLFDAEAKAQFPNAFKNGMIDTSTPAGNAIKKARDLMNDHLYEVAPNGSEIQALIRRESDLLNANEVISKKALMGEGKKTLGALIDKHPVKAGIGGTIAAGTIGTGVINALK